MTSDLRIGLAVVGPGAIADAHLAAFDSLGGVEPLWAVGRSADRTQVFADRWRIARSSTFLDEVLADERVQVGLICSPNAVHASQARDFIEAGKDVIIEIPIAMSGQEATSLVDLAEERGRRIFACHTMRSFEGVRHLRELISSGRESITQIQGYFAIPRRNNEGFSGTRTWIDDLLWHHACHLVDATIWITGGAAIENPWLLQGDAHPEFGMTMDLMLAFSCTSPTTSQRTIASHALTYQASHLAWQLRLAGRFGDYCFDTGRLTGTGGQVLVADGSIRDLRVQNAQIINGLRSGSPTDFEASSVLPAMRALDQLQEASSRT